MFVRQSAADHWRQPRAPVVSSPFSWPSTPNCWAQAFLPSRGFLGFAYLHNHLIIICQWIYFQKKDWTLKCFRQLSWALTLKHCLKGLFLWNPKAAGNPILFGHIFSKVLVLLILLSVTTEEKARSNQNPGEECMFLQRKYLEFPLGTWHSCVACSYPRDCHCHHPRTLDLVI